jgi:hypothetical protein
MTEGVFPVKIIDTKIFWTVNLELMLLELSRFFRKFAINDLIPNAKNVTAYQALSGAIRRYQALSGAIRRYQALSGAIRRYQALSGAIRRIRALVPSARGQQAIELSRSCIWI